MKKLRSSPKSLMVKFKLPGDKLKKFVEGMGDKGVDGKGGEDEEL
jgi:hypothetical protein